MRAAKAQETKSIAFRSALQKKILGGAALHGY